MWVLRTLHYTQPFPCACDDPDKENTRALLASRDCAPSHSRPKVSAARFWKERASESSAYGVAMSRAKWSVTRMRSGTGGLLPAQRLAARAFVCHQRGAARDGTGPIEERSKRTDARAHGVLGVRGGRPVEKRVQGRAEADIPALFRASTSRRSIVYSTGFRTRSRAPSTPRAAQRPFQSYGVLVIRLFLKLWYTRHLLSSIGKVPVAI